MRGLKHDHKTLTVNNKEKSHPIRVRGLKQRMTVFVPAFYVSHPIRVRGLKRVQKPKMWDNGMVAPYTGAWIETVPLWLIHAAS